MKVNVSGTTVDEIADGIYRIATPVAQPAPGFSFNQYLVLDDAPLLFHTGPRRMFPSSARRWPRSCPSSGSDTSGFSHYEADECGSLNEWLAVAPAAAPVCSQVAALVSVDDVADRPARPLADGEILDLGRHRLRWHDTPHLPHGWESGYLFDATTRTLLCGDLFTQGGADTRPRRRGEILGPSEEFRKMMDYYSHTKHARPLLEKLAAEEPTTLARMHGSAWKGNGAELLRALATVLEAPAA